MILRILGILSLLVIITNQVTAQITEINFIGEEYIEIVSNTSINFSEFLVFDENGKNNSIVLYQNNNATMTIIAGSNFYGKYTNLNLSCNYYLTSGSQLSNGGLKSSGESISISNNTTKFSWNKTEEVSFQENQSLHFSNSTQFISNQSICSKSSLKVDSNNSIQNQTNSTMNQNICNNSFSIKIKEREITQKIEFDFDINYEENISINYWVENYEQEILKNPLMTENTNTKSYTPTKTNPIIIKAILNQNNCTYTNQSETFFYKYEEKQKEEQEEIQQEYEKESKLLIKSKEIIDQHMRLSIELYRGDTAKRVLNIYNNNKKLSSIEIPTKYGKVKSTIMIPLETGENSIVFQGIELDHELNHFIEKVEEETNLQVSEKIVIPKVSFFNLSIEENIVQRPFFSSGKLLISCTIYKNKTKVSDSFDLEIEGGFYIIENNLYVHKLTQDTIELKQTCKYKEENRKTFKYESVSFNYTKTQENDSFKLNDTQVEELEELKNKSLHIKSSNTHLKEKANLPIMGAMSLLIISMVLMW